jgi:carboxypeptidase T
MSRVGSPGSSVVPVLLALAAAVLLGAGTAAAAGRQPVSGSPTQAWIDYPPGFEEYHTYAEMERALDDAVAGYPDLVRKFSIGRSYEGREIWAVKISDNVALDEDEPEVHFECNIHAREHLTAEMCLYVLRLLTAGYGVDERITQIVDSTELYLIPMLNPDGVEHDIASGLTEDGRALAANWRKNRQPIPDTDLLGIDLNRNYGFNWACCKGGSNNPASITYRGWAPWVAPEVVAHRNFINSRVVNGRQQIRMSISWHTYGELVMWPYGYTKTALPKTMSADDLSALQVIGRQLAAFNGYTAKQKSGMYITDGTTSDWLYHDHRIIAFTFEMYPPELNGRELGGFYAPQDLIAAETERNREAVLWFLEQADCPHRVAGLVTHCGPLSDDFETDRGWTIDPFGTDSATAGRLERGVPAKTRTAAGIKQRAVTPSGQAALVTGLAAGANANANDVDGGLTSAASPVVSLAAGNGWRLSFRYAFAHNARARKVDFLRLSVVDGARRTVVFSQLGRKANRNAVWTPVTLNLDAFAGRRVRLLLEVADHGADSLIEAALDDVRVYPLP